ncbi:helix-turn-helix domain-containing protein [Epilithonimonas arachidiradicis]|uniref:AraC family transcriptional regulator n=1 Tax=Epilithonimonas arachidiradicis TaxID=1617282 RepID=A0A420D8S9_9FLAO|nr:helix-turn-helix domain-containing protein [Epilithonimonas arachidiradicis]RKE87143.1 AraC family transcriptional regulator [Epilithonimonas arachidiradicis]
MNRGNDILFFFSLLGAFNGLLLAVYFGLAARKKGNRYYFLALLILMLSIRVIKSVFFHFNPHLSDIFIQIGLSACILVGPFLYLYVAYERTKLRIFHIAPFLIVVILLGILYPYFEYRELWSQWIVRGIYLQWLIYIIVSLRYIKPIVGKIRGRQRLDNIDVWQLSIVMCVFLIWLAYSTAAYTSYIVGALSFSFLFYLVFLLVIFRNSEQPVLYQEKERYKNKIISEENILKIEQLLPSVIEREMFLNPDFTLDQAAKELKISKHVLSQYLNEKLNKSFSSFINECRIEKAKVLLQNKSNYSVESVGYESGFSSKSSFFTAFKKITGQTPSEFQKSSKN